MNLVSMSILIPVFVVLCWCTATCCMLRMEKIISPWARENMDSSLARSLAEKNIRTQMLMLVGLYLLVVIVYLFTEHPLSKAMILIAQGMTISASLFYLWARFLWSKKMPGYRMFVLLTLPPTTCLVYLTYANNWFSLSVTLQLVFLGILCDLFVAFGTILLVNSRDREKISVDEPPEWLDF